MKRIKKRTGRIAAMLLALAMVVTSLPQYALTASAEEAAVEDITADTENTEAEVAAESETGTEVVAAEEAETETADVSETEAETETEAVTEQETETETEKAEEESRTEDVLNAEDGDTAEKRKVTIPVPYCIADKDKGREEYLLERFQYAVYENEPQGEVTLDKEIRRTQLRKGQDIKIEVSDGSILYFKPTLKTNCEIDSVTYGSDEEITAENGVYKISGINGDMSINISAHRSVHIKFKAEGAKIYHTLEDIQNNNELTELTITVSKVRVEGADETFYVVPEENKAIKFVDSNSVGVKVARDRKDKNDFNAPAYTITVDSSRSIQDITTISAEAEELKTYTAVFEWNAQEVDVSVSDSGEDPVPLSESNKTVSVTESGFPEVYMKLKSEDSEKSILVKYTDEVTGETVTVQPVEYHEEEGEYYCQLGGEEGISGNVSVNISVVDICSITFNVVNSHVTEITYRYNDNEEIGELPIAEDDVAKPRECIVKVPAGYELTFWVDTDCEYGTLAVSSETVELEEEYIDTDGYTYFRFTPAADTAVTLDVKGAEFVVDADEGVAFSLCQRDDYTDEFVDIDIPNHNKYDYYNNEYDLYIKIREQEGKRYEVKGEFDDYDGGTEIRTLDDKIYGVDGYLVYRLSIGECKKVFIRSYDLVTLRFENVDGDSDSYNLRKFYTSESDSWESVNIEDNMVTADKNEVCFIGISYDSGYSKLDYISTTGDAGGNLEFYETCLDSQDGETWWIYKVVPAAGMTIRIKMSQLEAYTVIVKKGDGVTSYDVSSEGNISESSYDFGNVTENSTFSVTKMTAADSTYVQKVEYEVDGGAKQTVRRSYDSYGVEGYHIKITGNTTIYIDAVPAESYTLKFDSTDGFKVKIWEAGNDIGFEEAAILESDQITLTNDKAYLFDIIPEDRYITERVTATDAGGTETLIERNTNSRNDADNGYSVGTGYGHTGNLTVKISLKDAYRLIFEVPSESDLDVYSWEDLKGEDSLNNERTAVAATDSYSFYIPGYTSLLYEMTVRESDSFTLTKDYRTVREDYDTVNQYAVYTVARKPGVTQPAATATIVIAPNNDTYEVTLSNEAPEQIKSVHLAYYEGASGNSEYYELEDGKANVANSVFSTVQVQPIKGYTAKVTMSGASGTNELKQVRNDSGTLDYGIGELTENKTIAVTVERTDESSYYAVGFATKNAVIREPEYKLPYLSAEYNTNGAADYICGYYVAKGSSISFTVEPEYGYKVESVSVRSKMITPDANGIYTVKPTYDQTAILVKTAESNTPDDPDTPVNPDDPAKKTSTVTFNCSPEVSVTVGDVKPDNNQYTVETGKQISFKAVVTDENYEIKSVTTGDGVAIPYDEASGTYTVTINADTEIVITAAQKQGGTDPEDPTKPEDPTDPTDPTKPEDPADSKAPTAVTVKNVSKGQLTLNVQSRKYDITLTPSDADGSVLGVKVNPEDSVIKASIVSETRASLIKYYLQLEKPKESTGDKADLTIYNTKTGEAIAGGTFTVVTKTASAGSGTVDDSGLKIYFDGYQEYDENNKPSYTYTGSAVTLNIDEVAYNGITLEQGTDYTIKYTNNINASNADSAKPATLTITGKGRLSGKHEYKFNITRKNIGDLDVRAGSVKVVQNAKATPVLVYNGMVLGKKDYDNPSASTKFSADTEITLIGVGNYEGSRKIKVEVVSKDALKKLTVKPDSKKNNSITYDGGEKYPAFDVLDAKTKQNITDKENTAYIVVYPENITDAGSVKFTVVGIGDYTGSVTKSYKIKPSAAMADSITVSEPDAKGYTYVSTGVTAYEPTVTLKGKDEPLVRGRDYTLAYSSNKKAGTAKCKVSFTGNYKGIKAQQKNFTINKFNIADFAENDIIVTDKTSGGKDGVYQSVPYIIDRNADALVKSSEFKFTYYLNGKEMKGKDGKCQEGVVQVKIEPKNKEKGNYTGERTVTYNIRKTGTDLSKAKITFTPNRLPYTGGEVIPAECSVEVNKAKIDNSKNDKYQIIYLGNINKGKATAIIVGAAGSEYVGSRTATFTITASALR